MKSQAFFDGRKLWKRVRQAAYVSWHPLHHRTCTNTIRSSRLPFDQKTLLKYVGDHLALSLSSSQRREVLVKHYATFPNLLQPRHLEELRSGIRIWEKSVAADLPPLLITLERSMLAPMEGELQLRFSFKTDLCVLTFSVAPGHVFGVAKSTVLFIGGVQGRTGSRVEVREAARLNSELSPRALLALAIQALARAIDIDEIVAVGEDDHISRAYARSKMSFDYARFWTKLGGVRVGRHYLLPMESPQKPLTLVAASHRSRARRRREIKLSIRESLDQRFRQLTEGRFLKS